MSKPPYSLIEARDAFIDALADYQAATLELSRALHRMTEHNHRLHRELDSVVRQPGIISALAR